ncbi:MAG TPA: ATP-binding protein, partial [Chitinophagaceae bacterium]|nr:ATP-binding protein [Chitinophagaceae bacterium]
LLSNSMLLEYTLKHYQRSLAYIEQIGPLQVESSQVTIITYKALNLVGLNRLNDAWDVLKEIKDRSGQSGLSRVIQNGEHDLDYAFYKYYLATKEISKAERYLLRSYENAKMDATLRNEVTYLKELSQFYDSQRKMDKAWQYTVLYNRLNDSIQLRTNRFNVASYENEQKELEQNRKMALLQQEHAVQEATIGQRNMIIWISLIGLVAVLGSLILIYRQLQINKRNLNNLKSTQAQLIQSEKMASLGELTAGIAHEIQNPLNFVNNFSEVNNELIEELKMKNAKFKTPYDEEEIELLNDIYQNNEKINHHGKRADAIVKGMLQHTRSSSGVKELTNINALADEYLRLAYHGLRAKDNSFNATMKTDYDKTIGSINIVPQDIGRVLLNLYNNAFYACTERSRSAVGEKNKMKNEKYEPTVSVSTKKINNKVEIKVMDNGGGIPQKVLDKIFQPFFTTKPTGQGTGLGLSLSYDIIKAHAGEIKVETREREGSEFIILLPITA